MLAPGIILAQQRPLFGSFSSFGLRCRHVADIVRKTFCDLMASLISYLTAPPDFYTYIIRRERDVRSHAPPDSSVLVAGQKCRPLLDMSRVALQIGHDRPL